MTKEIKQNIETEKNTDNAFTNLPVKEKTKQRVIALKASKSQPYDDVINKLIDIAPANIWETKQKKS